MEGKSRVRSQPGEVVRRAAVLAVLAMVSGGPSWAAEKPAVLRAVEGLRYDPPRLRATPGERLVVRFENADTTAQPHNVVIVRPGAREGVLAAALALGADGPARAYVPAVPEVIAASRLLAAGESESVVVPLPAEPGIYPIVCTFPGHGVIMFGAVYAGVEMPEREEDDPHVPKPAPPLRIDPDPRPMVRRTFLPLASPAAIAVALPGDMNLCWDAGPCRLRYGWFGPFLDSEDHFKGKGQALAQLGGPVAWSAPDTFPIRFGGRLPKQVAFRGYALESGMPAFEYTVDGQSISEGFSVDGRVLIRRFRFTGITESVTLDARLKSLDGPMASKGTMTDGMLRLEPTEAVDVVLRYSMPPVDGSVGSNK
jgi:azurin